jgi:hypothetical protein
LAVAFTEAVAIVGAIAVVVAVAVTKRASGVVLACK